MFRSKTNGLMAVLLALVVVFAFAGCEKLSYSKLSANYHFSKANRFFTENQYRKAITEYEAALKNDPRLVQAYRFLGESYKQLYKPAVDNPDNLEKSRKALEALNKAYEIEPNNKEIIYSLGDMYDKLGKFPEAEKLYLRILELEPGEMGNYYVLAEFYKRFASEKKEIAQKAESMYLRRIEADPENPQGYAYIANYFETLPSSDVDVLVKNYDRANEYWEKRIALQPDSAEAYLAKGVNRWSRSFRFQNLSNEVRKAAAYESLAALQKAVELDPNYPEPYSWLSVLYKSVLAKLEPEKDSRYSAEADRYIDKFQDLRKRSAERKKLEEDLKKTG